MEPKSLNRRGNSLQVQFEITDGQNVDVKSPAFVINGKAVFQVMLITSRINDIYSVATQKNNHICVRFYQHQPFEKLNYNIFIKCEEFGIISKRFRADVGTWHRIHETINTRFTFNISVVIRVISPANLFAPLHNQEELTDFELRGEDGTVRVHKAVLAASSPVLKRMLCGTWRETTEGHVEIPGTTKETLQHLKDYIYLYKLPEVGHEQLLLLASYYIMPELEHKCVDILAYNLTAQNICDLLEFAVKNKVTKLMLAIIDSIGNNEVKADDIRKHVNGAIVDTENHKESKVDDK